LQESDKWNIIEECTREIFGKPVNIILQKDDSGSQEESESAAEQENIEKKVLSDPVVIELLKEFPGSRIADIVKIDPEKDPGTGKVPDSDRRVSAEAEGFTPDLPNEEEEEED
jgi:hypothetical protein